FPTGRWAAALPRDPRRAMPGRFRVWRQSVRAEELRGVGYVPSAPMRAAAIFTIRDHLEYRFLEHFLGLCACRVPVRAVSGRDAASGKVTVKPPSGSGSNKVG